MATRMSGHRSPKLMWGIKRSIKNMHPNTISMMPAIRVPLFFSGFFLGVLFPDGVLPISSKCASSVFIESVLKGFDLFVE